MSRVLARAVAFVLLGLGLGAAAGVAWWAVVDLPAYVVNSDGGASISERGLTEFLAGDAWFCALGLVVGALIGLGGWRWFRDLGWPLVLGVCGLAVAASLVCWLVGYQLGPGEFAPRLAAARPGDLVPIELTLRTTASLLVWPFAGGGAGAAGLLARPRRRGAAAAVTPKVGDGQFRRPPARQQLGQQTDDRTGAVHPRLVDGKRHVTHQADTQRRRSGGSDRQETARPPARACRPKRRSLGTR